MTEADRAYQRLVERGTSLVEGAATEQEKYAEQVKALDAALATRWPAARVVSFCAGWIRRSVARAATARRSRSYGAGSQAAL
jgi:hypothetical protein